MKKNKMIEQRRIL